MLNKVTKKIYGSQVSFSDNIGYYYDFGHNANTDEILIGVFDDNGKLMNTNGLFERLDDNTVRIFFPNDSVNFWTVYVFYEDEDTIETAPKKRLFEQTELEASDLNSYLDFKLAMGGPGMATYNVSLAQFKTFCQATLNTSLYLLKSNNLSDVSNVATARQNLDVYSKADVDSMFAAGIPAAGYVNAIGPVVEPSPSVVSNLAVISSKDSRGINLDISFNMSATTLTEQYIGQINVIANTGVTFDCEDDYFPVFLQHSNGSFTFGQMRVSPTITGTGATLSFLLSMYSSDGVDGNCVIHYNINKA